jgi:hypothetical protein
MYCILTVTTSHHLEHCQPSCSSAATAILKRNSLCSKNASVSTVMGMSHGADWLEVMQVLGGVCRLTHIREKGWAIIVLQYDT